MNGFLEIYAFMFWSFGRKHDNGFEIYMMYLLSIISRLDCRRKFKYFLVGNEDLFISASQ